MDPFLPPRTPSIIDGGIKSSGGSVGFGAWPAQTRCACFTMSAWFREGGTGLLYMCVCVAHVAR
jgi:hypothetical protein